MHTYVCVCVRACVRACVHVCTQYATVHFLVCSTFTYYIYVLKSELVAVHVLVLYMCTQIRVLSCLYLFNETSVCKFLHGLTWQSYMARNLFILYIVFIYTFFSCIFLYGVLCFRFHWGSSALEMSVINPFTSVINPFTSVINPFTAPACKFLGWKVHIYTLTNSTFDGLIINLLSVLWILIEILSGDHVKGRQGLNDFKFGFLLVVSGVMVRQAWQWKG